MIRRPAALPPLPPPERLPEATPAPAADSVLLLPEAISEPVRRGSPCPRCGLGRLEYNGMLDLECPVCGFYEGTIGACT